MCWTLNRPPQILSSFISELNAMLNDATLNIRQLQVFEAVARLESYGRAQQELGISVSAISNAMSQLEGQLGFSLCQRGRGGFALTEIGSIFYSRRSAC